MSVNVERTIEKLKAIRSEQQSLKRGKTTLQDQLFRRTKILSMKQALKKELKKEPTSVEIKDSLNFIEYQLKLENFMLSVPRGVSVIPREELKHANYSNDGLKFETRLYLCPHFEPYDNDSISMVVALTPAHYIQPPHIHTITDEFTTSIESPLKVLTIKESGKIDTDNVKANRMAHIPKGVIHTIETTSNPNVNVSIKVPESLRDRHNVDEKTKEFYGIWQKPSIIEPEIERHKTFEKLRWEVSNLGYQYQTTLKRYFGRSKAQLKPQESQFLFVSTGEFKIKQRGLEPLIAETHSLIVIDPGEEVFITPTGQYESNTTYSVELRK